jgi:hypothetical protein
MAFKSHAQKQHFQDKLQRGEIDQKTFDAYGKDTPKMLPHRVGEAPKLTGPRSLPSPRSIAELKQIAKKKLR